MISPARIKQNSLTERSVWICWALPVVVSKHGAVTVAKVQTPDLHVPVGGASGDKCVILSETEEEELWVKIFKKNHTVI